MSPGCGSGGAAPRRAALGCHAAPRGRDNRGDADRPDAERAGRGRCGLVRWLVARTGTLGDEPRSAGTGLPLRSCPPVARTVRSDRARSGPGLATSAGLDSARPPPQSLPNGQGGETLRDPSGRKIESFAMVRSWDSCYFSAHLEWLGRRSFHRPMPSPSSMKWPVPRRELARSRRSAGLTASIFGNELSPECQADNWEELSTGSMISFTGGGLFAGTAAALPPGLKRL